jgi:HEAT repeat protein
MSTDDAIRRAERLRRVIVAGHTGERAVVEQHLTDADPGVRAAALGALERLGALDDHLLVTVLDDDDPGVRRRAVELAAQRPHISLVERLDDDDATVVEVAAWACGEHERVSDEALTRLIELATGHDDALVREASAAALGAIGDERGLPAIIAACSDKPHVRRRAVLALAPFDGDEVEATIERALSDRDWQVRQSAEDLRRAGDDLA